MRDSFVNNYLEQVRELLEKVDSDKLEAFADVVWEAHKKGSFVFACGNGGSAATASHFIEDLAKGIDFPPGEPRFRALALTDSVSLLTAYANDLSYADIFSEQLENFVSPGDVLIAFSGSGNSENVLRALEKANSAGASALAFGGMEGGKMKDIAQHCIIVPSDNMQQIEDCHLVLAHALYALLRIKGESKSKD